MTDPCKHEPLETEFQLPLMDFEADTGLSGYKVRICEKCSVLYAEIEGNSPYAPIPNASSLS